MLFILKHLFLQYDKNPGPTFASRFMKAVGNIFIGTLADKGLGHLRKDIRETYFYIKEDRQLPPAGPDLEEWELDGILLAQHRDVEAPLVARAVFYILLPTILAIVALAMVLKS
ncbi:hypothetical protein [Arenimonas sp. MALMAid1274]|uniref:hypothetical protein n=1 Tax=Arenimonas sp. MALMAid1274 TaxID=3411630 RepID=UPI003BA1DECE